LLAKLAILALITDLLKAPRDFVVLVLFLACSAFFINRGPYRAIRFSTTGDFSTVYAAARSWLTGTNPYEREALKIELSRAGAPLDIQRDQDINPSVYLPAAMPWAASVSWLTWIIANILWCLVSLTIFIWSVWKVLCYSALSTRAKWIAASAVLLFSPTYVGIYDGNPGVIAIGLIVGSICLAFEGRMLISGVTLGVATCFKPQLAICALGVLVLARWWKAIIVAIAVAAVSMTIGLVILEGSAERGRWWQSEQQNLAVSFEPGGQSDPAPRSVVAWQFLNAQTLSSYLSTDWRVYDVAVWIGAGLLILTFLWTRKQQKRWTPWRDAAFCSAMTLIPTYHRYYDAQLLVLLLPFGVLLWQADKRGTVILMAACLGVLAFPIQSFFAQRLGAAATIPSLKQFIFLRNQPVALIVLAIALTFCCAGLGEQASRPASQAGTGI
jgi:glycosyl transferase family 87